MKKGVIFCNLAPTIENYPKKKIFDSNFYDNDRKNVFYFTVLEFLKVNYSIKSLNTISLYFL